MISPCRIAYLVTANERTAAIHDGHKSEADKKWNCSTPPPPSANNTHLDLTTTAEETDVSNDKKLNYSRLLVSAKDNFLSREKAHP